MTASDEAQGGAKRKVLLVDDDKFLLDMYTLKFNQSGYDVHACLSVADALDILAKGFMPEAILFDLIMPDKDGFAFLQELRARSLAPGAIKVALSNQSADSDQMRAKDLGADLCLVKASLIPSEVVNTLNEVLRARTQK